MQRSVGYIVRRAFTIVEMIVVIAVIGLILAIGVPAFNAMTVQERMSKTRQLLNGTLTRTHVISVSDRTLAAVRICPAEWHLDKGAVPRTSAGRQIMTTYSYRATYAADPTNPTGIQFDERFEPIENGPTQLLPPDTWIAPSEALLDNDGAGAQNPFDGDEVLRGNIGAFRLDATGQTGAGVPFLSADDFLIVFDPDTGVQMQRPLRANWKTWRLLAFDPRPAGVETGQLETDGVRNNNGVVTVPFRRYNFAGAVIYQREAFEASGVEGDDESAYDARRAALERSGLSYYVSRAGGTLIGGSGE